MNFWGSIFFITVSLSLGAGIIEDAEQLFYHGRFSECGKLLEKNPDLKLNQTQQLKRQAMLEYLSGSNPEQIAANVKKAKEIAGHRNWVASDILNHAAFLIRRAESWKSRGIPEYQELSDAAAKLLSRLNDGANPEIAIKHVVLQTRNLNLNGEYDQPIEQIQNVLRLYYPEKRHAAGQKRGGGTGEIQLLILLGEQYSGQSVSTRNIQSKTVSLTAAAKCYLRALRLLSPRAGMYKEISDRLCHIRETLRIMGYNLNLPNSIRPSKPVAVAMIDEMLRLRRFQDVILILENKHDHDSRLRYALALSAVGHTDKAVSAVKELKNYSKPEFLLKCARHALSAGKENDAAYFLRCFLKTAPDSPDARQANEMYINILMRQKKYLEAADLILRHSDLVSDPARKEELTFLAAQCYYLSGKYAEAVRLCRGITPLNHHQLLQAKAEIKLKDYSNSLNRLKTLLQSPKLSETEFHQSLTLAIYAANESNSPDTGTLLETFLKRFPSDADMAAYAYQLLAWYSKQKPASDKLEKLAAFYCRNSKDRAASITFLLKCADQTRGTKSKEEILRNFLLLPSLTASELTEILNRTSSDHLKQTFIKKFRIPFENTPEICRLYLIMANTEFSLGNDPGAMDYLNHLLCQPEIFRYQDCKKLQLRINIRQRNETEVRKICQELLQSKLSLPVRRQIALFLAESWERSGENQKAIASAWTVIPPDGRGADREDTHAIQKLLNLIIRNAQKSNSKTDLEDAKDILIAIKP
ncbi:MAG: tetratricopeptide repeat protein [Lentisphaeria bacterium]|nr:tetratricopeptide repeat protein [Lentisphaeria bacterium]